jgi:hypothetical protein
VARQVERLTTLRETLARSPQRTKAPHTRLATVKGKGKGGSSRVDLDDSASLLDGMED